LFQQVFNCFLLSSVMQILSASLGSFVSAGL
jgi:hypothetical protein